MASSTKIAKSVSQNLEGEGGSSEPKRIPNYFTFWNGDEYAGRYLENRAQGKLVRKGVGVYKTADGHMYEGVWEDDNLRDVTKITFQDKSTFIGGLENMVIQGPGKYTFKEKVEIEGEFIDNQLVGRAYLKDPTGHVWRADIKPEDTYANFLALHPFWQVLFYRPTVSLFYGEADELQ